MLMSKTSENNSVYKERIILNELKRIIKSEYKIEISKIEKNEESTDGNVYIVHDKKGKYVMKIYDSIEHTNTIVGIHNLLSSLYIPRIIKTINNEKYLKYNNKYIVIYSFLEGNQISDIDFISIIPIIAKELKKMHYLVKDNKLNIKKVPFDVDKSLRMSILHFDLTKNNIFYHNGKVGFIDFDDAKFGPAICDISIIISFLFISKKRGIDNKGIKIFIDSYYENDLDLKTKEMKYLKEYALKWINYLQDNNEFDTSLKESFETKKEYIEKQISG